MSTRTNAEVREVALSVTQNPVDGTGEHDAGISNGPSGRAINDPADNRTVIPGRGHLLKNNLGFAGETEVAELDVAASDVSGNYFNVPVEITAEDFLGLDEADLVKPRQPNGDLPDVPLLRLAPGSDAIDRGVDIGLPFKGRAPDLGAFESEAGRGL